MTDEDQTDILTIDAEIKSKFHEDKKNVGKYKERLLELEKTLKTNNFPERTRRDLEKNIEMLKEKIIKIESGTELEFYIADTAEILHRYKEILRKPVRMSFTKKVKVDNEEKREIIKKYVAVAQKYHKIVLLQKETKPKIECEECGNNTNFEIFEDTIYICEECGTQKEVYLHTLSYKDIDRVNISTRYSYDRKVHFRDCINQYQGKQNSTIDQKIYDELEKQFESHHLLVGDKHTERKRRFSKITKEHIMMFLKDLGLTKHYENVNLIHYNFTGIKPDDISHLEDRLLTDFDILTETYDRLFKNKINRTNFINTQYVLYQLLQRHKHPCNKEDFAMLKTIDRQSFHDDVVKTCFQELGWNHNPYF
jgi:ribosomal protein L37AE/L43A